MAKSETTGKIRWSRFAEQSRLDIEAEDHANGILNQVCSYYEGASVAERLNKIRPVIYEIRQNWEAKYDSFVAETKMVLNELHEDRTRQRAIDLWDQAMVTPHNWCDLSDISNDSFKVLEIYTTTEGYQTIFRVMNNIFRKDSSDREILAAVFIVELINIDLFNYCQAYPDKSDFQGVVYRGFAVTKQDHNFFKEIMSRLIADRYISVPLSLQSSSKSEEIAVRFAKEACDRQQMETPLSPLIMRIHVISLPDDRLHEYKIRFPNSAVSTICAVDVSQESTQEEEEVLLRGAFFQVIGISEKTVQNETMTVVEAVMLNTNRDHLSNAYLGQDDSPARNLIGTLVKLTRNEYVANYLETSGTRDAAKDFQLYREAAEDAKRMLAMLLDEIPPK